MFQPGSEQNKLLDTPFQFRRHGKAGILMSEVVPHLGSVADELCLIRSMHTGHNNHTEGLIMLMTGKIFQGRPSLRPFFSLRSRSIAVSGQWPHSSAIPRLKRSSRRFNGAIRAWKRLTSSSPPAKTPIARFW